MPCPFLTRLSQTYVRNYGSSLLKMYGNHCPVISRSFHEAESTDVKQEGTYKQERGSVGFL